MTRTSSELPVPALLTLAAVLLAWLGWWLGGVVAQAANLGDLELPVRAAGILAVLALAEAAQARLGPRYLPT